MTTPLSELCPPGASRCGRGAAVGASRVLVGAARGFTGYRRHSHVALGGGSATVEVDLRTPHGRQLFGYGFCEVAATTMQELLHPGDTMIDGGANIGLYTLLAAARVGSRGHVLSCEPSPTTMALLRANVLHNGFDWVRLKELAIADVEGRMAIQTFEPGSGFTSFAPPRASRANEIEVEVATLDRLAEDLGERVKLVKLDIEGAELRALRGATRLLSDARPDFIVELEPEHLERQGGSAAELQELFESAGYVAYRIRPAVPLERPWIRPEGDPNILVRAREHTDR